MPVMRIRKYNEVSKHAVSKVTYKGIRNDLALREGISAFS